MSCCNPGELPHTQPSPRLVCGELRWYANDTFDITIDIDITDQQGQPVAIQPTDTVTVEFYNLRGETVKTFTFTGITDNAVTLEFDTTVSALFTRGTYTYDIYFAGDKRKTLANNNKAVVE